MHPLSTSNHNDAPFLIRRIAVVLHPLSTSNHNSQNVLAVRQRVVLHPLSTSNHNLFSVAILCIALYCILFLHQTTTLFFSKNPRRGLYCILFLHQTTTFSDVLVYDVGCIASSFYIKPQRFPSYDYLLGVVLHPLSTSNHNSSVAYHGKPAVVLHPLSTSNHNIRFFDGRLFLLYCILFLHQTTTSDARHFDFRALNSQ